MVDATALFVEALENSGRKVKTTGNDRWLAQCPGHDDGNPSLSIMRGRGQALTFCFAGCTVDQIAAGVNMTIGELFDEAKGISYEYFDQGKLARTVHRTPDKKFQQSIVDKGVVPLYVPPAVDIALAISLGQPIWIPEGEKDAETLVRHGVLAVSSPMGASAWAKANYEPLRGHSDLIIVADRDQPGIDRAQGLRDLLLSYTTGIVSVVQSAVGKDVTDHIVAGLPLSDMVPLVAQDPIDEEFEAEVAFLVRRTLVQAEAKRRSSGADLGPKLSPKSLGDLLKLEFEHDWLIPGLLERRDRLVLTGTEGTGKSHLLRQIAISSAAGLHPFKPTQTIKPLRVLVVDAENSEQQWSRGARYVADLSRRCGSGDPMANVTVSAGTRLDFTRKSDVDEVHRLIDTFEPDLLYIGPLYKLVPKEISTDDDAAPLIVALDSLRERGLTMLMEAHAGHSKGSGGDRDLRPRGSSALMGWPEFGMGLRLTDFDDSMVNVVKWRGDREVRDWPSRLRRGLNGEMPWVPVRHLGGE